MMKTIEQWIEVKNSVQSVFAFLTGNAAMRAWLQNLAAEWQVADHAAPPALDITSAELNRAVTWRIAADSHALTVEATLEETLLGTTLMQLVVTDESGARTVADEPAIKRRLQTHLEQLKPLMEADGVSTHGAAFQSSSVVAASTTPDPSTTAATNQSVVDASNVVASSTVTTATLTDTAPANGAFNASHYGNEIVASTDEETLVKIVRPTRDGLTTENFEQHQSTHHEDFSTAAIDDVTHDAPRRDSVLTTDDAAANYTADTRFAPVVANDGDATFAHSAEHHETLVRPIDETVTRTSETTIIRQVEPAARFEPQRSRAVESPAIPHRTARPRWLIPLLALLGLTVLGLTAWYAVTDAPREQPASNAVSNVAPSTSNTASGATNESLTATSNTASNANLTTDAPRAVATAGNANANLAASNLTASDLRTADTDTARTTNSARTAPPTPATSSSTNGDARQQLRTRLNEWTAATTERNTDSQMKFYAPTLERYYLRRNMTRAAVEADKQRLASRAQVIDLRVEGEPEIAFNDADQTATMKFLKRYAIQANGETTRGAVVHEMRWRKTADGWKIISERDLRVVR